MSDLEYTALPCIAGSGPQRFFRVRDGWLWGGRSSPVLLTRTPSALLPADARRVGRLTRTHLLEPPYRAQGALRAPGESTLRFSYVRRL